MGWFKEKFWPSDFAEGRGRRQSFSPCNTLKIPVFLFFNSSPWRLGLNGMPRKTNYLYELILSLPNSEKLWRFCGGWAMGIFTRWSMKTQPTIMSETRNLIIFCFAPGEEMIERLITDSDKKTHYLYLCETEMKAFLWFSVVKWTFWQLVEGRILQLNREMMEELLYIDACAFDKTLDVWVKPLLNKRCWEMKNCKYLVCSIVA